MITSSPAPQNPSAPAGQNRAGEQFRAILSGHGFVRLVSRRLALTGSDRVRWLNGMTTNNVRDLAPGHGVYVFVLNPQGHIQGDGYAFHAGESLLFDTSPDQMERIKDIFDRYIIMDDVEVAELPLRGLAIVGVAARAALTSAEVNVPELDPLDSKVLNWQDRTITLLRTDQPVIPEYQIWAEPSTIERFQQVLQSSGVQEVGSSAIELLRVASGVPRYGQDIRERDLPQETEQTRALNFNKGCYIGQEIVERIRSRGNVHRKFSGFVVEGTLPVPGAKIQVDGKDVGEVTSAAILPSAGRELPVALGYIRREHALPGRKVQAGNAELSITEIPFREVFEE